MRRTWWEEGHRAVHHWFESNDKNVYAVMLAGHSQLIGTTIEDMEKAYKGGYLTIREIPEKYAKRLPNNWARSFK